MISNFKEILKKAIILEKTMSFARETLNWPWPELLLDKNKLAQIKLTDFLAGFDDLDNLLNQGVTIKIADEKDYQKIAPYIESVYPTYSKIELLQLIFAQVNIVVTVPRDLVINISFTNPIFENWGNVYFIVGQRAKVTIIDQHITPIIFGAGSVYLISNEESQIEYLSMAGTSAYGFNLRSFPGRSAIHYLYAIGKMSEKYYYYNIMSYLKSADCQNYILSSLKFENDSKSIIKLQNNHVGQNTVGDIKFKGIGFDKSISKIDGLIEIFKKARQTTSYLKEDIILASDDSYIKAEPNLEILNNDVKASHGATIGYMDKNVLFYLMSRGLTKDKAEKLVADGFLKSLAKDIMSPNIKVKYESYWL